MKWFPLISFSVTAVSIAFMVFVVFSVPSARHQLLALDFPLTGLGEGVLGMLVPIVLSTLSVIAGLVAVRRKIGRVALIAASCSWLLIWAILGKPGFYHLF